MRRGDGRLRVIAPGVTVTKAFSPATIIRTERRR